MPDSIQPRGYVELNHIGSELFKQGQWEAARLHFLAALSLEPGEPTVLQNLGAALRNLGHHEAAESVGRRSVAGTKGQNPFNLQNFGVAQLSLKKYNDSIQTFKAALKLAPDLGAIWHNYGVALYTLGKHKEAIEAFDKALVSGHDVAQCRSDRALAYLSLGELQKGLEAYEIRWQMLHNNKIWKTPITEWQGESLVGKHLLLHHEQGFGDSLMLVRFVKQLSALGCQITVVVPGPLVQLFQQSFDYIRVISFDDFDAEDTSAYDYHTPMLSVMRWLGLQKPEDIERGSYLQARCTKDMRLPEAKFRVGICWASGNHGPILMERRRVVPLPLFLPLTEIPGVAVVGMQKGDGNSDTVRHGMEGLIYDVAQRIEDFADTAEIMSYLDLVISVDSAAAHLAGALGKPCIMLSPYTRCWRWWSNGTGWPWYNDMTQYHQAQDGSWNLAVMKAISQVRGIVSRNRVLED